VIYERLGAGEPFLVSAAEERRRFHVRALRVDEREKQGLFGRHGALAGYGLTRSCARKEEDRVRLLDYAILPCGVKGCVARHWNRESPLPPFRRPLPIRLAKDNLVRRKNASVLIAASLGKRHRCRHHEPKDDHDTCHYASPKVLATFHCNTPFE